MVDRRILILTGVLICLLAVLLTHDLTTHVAYILKLRIIKFGALIVVGAAIGISTILFQTLCQNRILTPSIMGFDALYLLLQTSMVFFFGGLGYAHLPSVYLFGLNTLALMIAAVFLFTYVMRFTRHDLQLMILVGVVFGLLFRSFTVFMQRLIDPSEFQVLQSVMFAQFGGINKIELICATVILAAVSLWLVPKCPLFDVMSLGRKQALLLGVAYDRMQLRILTAISALVAVTTALVGPIVFLGLLVSALTHSLMKTNRHALLLPASALISALILILGQAGFEHVLQLESTLTVLIEFVGGLLFLVLLARGKIK